MSAEIRSRLIDQLIGNLSLEDFESWLVSSSWDMPKAGWNDARELIAEIELVLAEFSLAHLSEHQLREELLTLVRDSIMVRDFSPGAYPWLSRRGPQTSSSAKSSELQWSSALQKPADIRFAREPA
jgi:hypothetical protein